MLNKILLVFFVLLIISLTVWSKEINIGFTAVITREDLKTIKEFLNYLSNKTQFVFNPVFAKSYDEMDFFFFSGKVDIGYICGAPFVEGYKRFGYSIVAVPTTSEGPYYYSYVIAKKDKPYKSILDFKGKPYAFSDPKSNSGSVVPSYFLLKLGQNPSEFFKPLIYTYSHYESILAVYKGFVEGASVDSIVYEHTSRVAPHLVSSLKVVQKFGPFPSTPIVASNKLDKSTVETIRKVLLEMHKDEEGRRILKSMGISGFTYVEPKHYRVIASMIEYIAKLNR
ncbi:phosphate/phosphite/phosphonate ABC transporter substrate-binding protein [Thermocrinis sp.]